MNLRSRSFACAVRHFLFVAACASILLTVGCGTGSILGPQPVSVTITNKFTTATTGAAATTLNATVLNDSNNSGVTWTLTVSGAACSPLCGSLSGATQTSVSYPPPGTVPAAPNNAPTITATSIKDAMKSDTDSFTIASPPISVTITNKVKAVQIGSAAITFNATVKNDPSGQGVTWSLSDTSGVCAPACGSLSNSTTTSVVYTPPPLSVPANPSNHPSISADSIHDPLSQDLDTFTIISSAVISCAGMPTGDEFRLNGPYAFFAQGFNSGAVVVAGSFAADGTGKIADLGSGVGGALDLNTSDGPLSVSINTTGSLYQVGADPTGAGDLGCLQLATSDGSTTIFQFSLAGPVGGAIASRGKIIEYDDQSGNGTGTRLAGILLEQDPTAFSIGSKSGSSAS